MSSGNPATNVYEFGPFRLDLKNRLLLRGERVLPLTPKAFDILLMLVENAGRVVGKEELMKRNWPDTFVGQTTLAQNIFTLRKVLGKDQHDKPYIKTIPKLGYRLLAEVREVFEREERPAAAERSGAAQTNDEGAEHASLAVLPFVNDGRTPDLDYLLEGITETLIYLLSQVPRLRVMSRGVISRYRGRELDPQAVGKELGVRNVLVGRLILKDQKLIIRVELIDVEKGWHLWGQQYDGTMSDLLRLEEEIAGNISEKLQLRLTEQKQRRMLNNYKANAETYQLYLKGRYYWNKQTEADCRQAVQFFHKAIELDRNYALAYIGLADAYVSLDLYNVAPPWEIMPAAKAAAIRAIELDNQLAEAHTSLGCVKMIYDRDWEAAEAEFKKALRLNPKYPLAHSWYSLFLLAVGRIEESAAESMRALELDPLDPHLNQNLGWHYLYTRQYDRAVEQLTRTLELDPDYYLAHLFLGRAYAEKGDYEASIAQFDKASSLSETPMVLGYLGHVYAMMGDRQAAQKFLKRMRACAKDKYVPPFSVGMTYLGMDDKEHALECFNEAFDLHNEWIVFAKVNPALDRLRSEASFKDLLNRLGLDD